MARFYAAEYSVGLVGDRGGCTAARKQIISGSGPVTVVVLNISSSSFSAKYLSCWDWAAVSVLACSGVLLGYYSSPWLDLR